jgi:sulfur relay (sulfurtransferase) DsrF/TusC family protein
MHQTTQRFVLYGANEVFITHPSLWCYGLFEDQ